MTVWMSGRVTRDPESLATITHQADFQGNDILSEYSNLMVKKTPYLYLCI